MEMQAVLWVVAVVLTSLGIAGILIPALPGILLVFSGLFAAAWAEGFVYVGKGTIITLAFLALVGYAGDALAGALGARHFGAGRAAVYGALAGTVAGMFFGLPGIVFGPFAGALAAELIIHKDLVQAGKAGFGAWAGMVAGIALKVAVVFAMIGLYLAVRFF